MHWYNIIEMLIELLIYSALVRARDTHIVYNIVCLYTLRCILTAGKRGQLIYKTIARPINRQPIYCFNYKHRFHYVYVTLRFSTYHNII